MKQENRKEGYHIEALKESRRQRAAVRRRNEWLRTVVTVISLCVISAGMNTRGDASNTYDAQNTKEINRNEENNVGETLPPIWQDYDMVLAALALQRQQEEKIVAEAFGRDQSLIEEKEEEAGSQELKAVEFGQSKAVESGKSEASELQTEPGTLLDWQGREIVYYRQTDKRFADKLFGEDPIGRYGCGPTVMATVVSTLTDCAVDPIQMAEWAYENGYWAAGSGAYHTLIAGASRAFSLKCVSCAREDTAAMKEALADGKLIVVLMGKGQFTDSGHFIVLYGLTEAGKVRLADPNSLARTEQEWELDVITKEAKSYAADGGPFWIISGE